MEWCIADGQTPDDELQMALDWACGKGGADCNKLQAKQPCYFPNTLRDHASYAFNDYYQKFKHQGATCYFHAAAMITDLDPSKITISNKLISSSYIYIIAILSLLYIYIYIFPIPNRYIVSVI